jgi:hypothetical protein
MSIKNTTFLFWMKLPKIIIWSHYLFFQLRLLAIDLIFTNLISKMHRKYLALESKTKQTFVFNVLYVKQ